MKKTTIGMMIAGAPKILLGRRPNLRLHFRGGTNPAFYTEKRIGDDDRWCVLFDEEVNESDE